MTGLDYRKFSTVPLETSENGDWRMGEKQNLTRIFAGMVPREDLEESGVRTGRDFPAGGNPCLSQGLTSIYAFTLLFPIYYVLLLR